jgi:hypothetical protein
VVTFLFCLLSSLPEPGQAATTEIAASTETNTETSAEAVSLPASAATPPEAAEPEALALTPERLLLYEALTGVAAAAISVPVTLALSTWLGSLSSNLIVAALPSLILLVALPPLAVTGAVYWLASSFDNARFQPAIWAALGVQVATVVVAALAGASSGNAAGYVALTGTGMILMPTAAILTMRLTRPDAALAHVGSLTVPDNTLFSGRSARGVIGPIAAWSF